jgi:CRP-like cAMP-binding protein
MLNYFLANEFTEFEELFKERFKNVFSFKKGEIVIGLNDNRDYSYYLLNGTVIFRIVHISGKCKISTFRGSGTIFPLYYTFQETCMEHELEVKAISDIEIIKIPKKDLHNLLIQNPAIGIKMCDAYCKYATYLLFDIENSMFENYTFRVCQFLYGYSQSINELTNNNKCINLTHEEIGMTIGATRANVSRIISQLKKNKIIDTKRHCIHVIDEKKLLEFPQVINIKK